MNDKRWAVYYAIWAISLCFLVGCDQDAEDLMDDMAELVKELVRLLLQWLME